MMGFFKSRMEVLAVVIVLTLFAGAVVIAGIPREYSELRELAETERSPQELAGYFRTLAEEKGASYAFQVLRRAKLPEGVDLHLLGHEVGYVLYDERGIAAIEDCTHDFRNACSHSVVISMLLEHGEKALPDISAACAQAPGGRGAYTMCYHGLGHGVLAYNGYRFEKAVAMCETIGTEAYEYQEYRECVGGAVMEMASGIHDPVAWEAEKGKYLRDRDPLSPCFDSFMPESVRPICLLYITPRLMTASGLDLGDLASADYTRAFQLCDPIPAYKKKERETCYGGFGKEFVAIAAGKDVRDIGALNEHAIGDVGAWCRMAGNEAGEAACRSHALASLFWGGENDVWASRFFCSSATGREQTRCFNELANLIVYYGSGTARGTMMCGELPKPYHMRCGL